MKKLIDRIKYWLGIVPKRDRGCDTAHAVFQNWAAAAKYAGLAVWCVVVAAGVYTAVRNRASSNVTREARLAAGVTNRIVTASWFGDNTLTETRFQEEILPTHTNVPPPVDLSPWAYANDWYITIFDDGSTTATNAYTEAWLDIFRKRARSYGTYRRYKVEVAMEEREIGDATIPPEVTWDISDPMNAATWDEANQTLTSTGVDGQVKVSATDTNDTTKTTVANMFKVAPDTVVKAFGGESPTTERYIWSTNVFAKLAAISTAEADMVTIYGCRDATITGGGKGSWSSHYSLVPWSYPRALSRWGTGGRMYTNEWAGQSQPFEKAHRTWCRVENHDFFWPELQTNLWCYSINCHEAAGDRSNFDGKIATAVAPHYLITANHTCWMWGRTPSQAPRFRYGTGDNEIMACDYRGMKQLGVIKNASGGDTDIAIFYTTNTIPNQCIAHFIRGEELRKLSLTGFSQSAAFTITTHQSVAPVCLNNTTSDAWSTNAPTASSGAWYLPGGWTGSWSPTPLTTAESNPYAFDESQIPANVRNLEHMTHMQDSSDPVFIAAPNGRIVPCSHIWMAGASNNGAGGPPYPDYVLDQMDAIIHSHSEGAEGLRYWTKADLWSGKGSNTIQ